MIDKSVAQTAPPTFTGIALKQNEVMPFMKT